VKANRISFEYWLNDR